MVCLKESLPEVREQIQNLADKLGVDYGTAKIILQENNGYDLDKAPSGAESELYQTLLEHYNGDERKALIAKAKTYLQPFFDWFGNWTDPEATNVSKVVDENGEPRIVWHTTSSEEGLIGDFFDFSKLRDDSALGKGVYTANTKAGSRELNEGLTYPLFMNIRVPYNIPDNEYFKLYELFEKSDYEKINEIIKKLIEEGYHGILHRNENVLWLDTNDIKSIDNTGGYSSNVNDIFDKADKRTLDDLAKITFVETTVLNAFGDDLNKLNTNIKKGIENRLKTLKRYSKRNLQAEEEISRLIDKLQHIDAREGVLEFVDHVQTTLASSVNWLRQPDLTISSRQLMQLKHDYLDFYYPMMKSVSYILNNTDEFKSIENYNRFSDNVNLILGNLQYVQNRFDHLLKTNTREFLKDYAEKSGSPYVNEMLQWLEDPKNDISWLSYYVGTSANTSNEVVRIMENIIRNTSNKTKRNTYLIGTELVDKLKKAKEEFGEDVMNLFREKDHNGLPTGMFTRDLNYGQMRQDETTQINKVVEKLGLSRDEDGNIEFPDYTSKQKFNKEMNKWYSENVERRYTSEYYELKNSLSEQTQSALDEIQKELNYIMGRYTIDDIFYSNILSDEEHQRLVSLLKEKENLSSLYYYDGTKKSGTDLMIAEELQTFRKKLQGKIKYKPNYTKFNKAIGGIISRYGVNSKEYDKWIKFNAEEVYSEEFYERLAKLERSEQTEEYKNLVQQRKDLLKLYRLPNSKNEYMDLSEEQQQMLTDLDKKISEARTKNPKNDFSSFAEIAYTQQYFDDYNRAKALGEEEFNKWFNRNHYEQGSRLIPNSRYTYIKPTKNLMSKYAKLEPGRFFKELDIESEFVNNSFDNDGDYIQPKRSKYDNRKAYNKITGSAKILYDALIDVMSESNQKIAFLGNANPFKLPQMSARDMTLLNQGGLTMDNIAYIFKDNMLIKDDDTDYNLSNSTRPDGSVIKHIPTRFIKMLDDPTKITTDVVGSVIMFYHMADNFKNMSGVQNDLEMILERLSQLEIKEGKNQKLAGTLNAFKKAQDLIDMNLYGMRKNRTTILGKDISKPMSNLYSTITKINLAWNPWAMATNAITGQAYTDIESILGRYYDSADIRFAKSELMSNLAELVSNIGNVNHKNKILMLMQFNQVSRSNEETFERLDQSALLRALNQHFWFNGFSAGDFIVKSQAMLSVYHNYKLIDGKFIPKNQFTGSKEEWDKAITLYDAYEIKDGKLQVKQQYLKYITEQLQNRIQNKVAAITAKIDGMLNDTDKAAIHANTYAQFLVMHRNFMIVGLEDRFKSKQFNYNTGEVESGLYTTVGNFIKNLVSSKNINILKQATAQYEQLDDFEKYNLKKVIMETANWIALTVLVSALLIPAADDDKDNWMLQSASYVAMRTAFEFRTLYNPFELTALLNSPSAAINIIETGAGMLKVILPTTYIGDNPFAPVKSGAYKGLPKVLRNIIKVTPGHHVFEALDESTIRAKRNYLENQLMF